MARKEKAKAEAEKEVIDESVDVAEEPAVEVSEGSSDSGAEPVEEKSPEEALLELKARLESERRARAAAEAEAALLKSDAEKVRSVANNAFERAYWEAERRLEASIAAANGLVNDLKRQYKDAYDSGDSDKMLEIQDKLMEAKIDLRGLVMQREALAQEKERAIQPQPVAGSDRFYIPDEVVNSLTKPTQEWIAKHPEFRTDEKFYRRAMRYHFEAIDDHNIVPDTPEYFDFLDKKLGFKSAEPHKAAVRGSDVSVPPSGLGGSQREDSRYIRLTEEEKEIADMMGMSYAKYAEHKKKLIEEGKIGGKR